ncbi:hypothetical protein MtrunA17_Chr7g0259351 [Medicago truncatula]|uniref:Uncharacterized protein n=2 Tax=Medicago truncatula TaxID=3880 RepID=A0A396HAR9_MEDTR|nr:hypothetical protein MtrunA17_Chr7g0259351 [Medicago truncatula]
MERNNTTTSNFSICRKFRQVLATNLTFKTMHRMKQQNQELKPQHIKIVNIEGGGGEGLIPITFDHSMVHSNASKVASPHVGISERKGKLVTDPRLVQSETIVKVEPDDRNVNIKQGMMGKIYNGKPMKVGLVNLEKQDKKSLDINDAFSEFIEREKNRIRTMSNVGKGQNNHVLEEANYVNKMENHNDHFSDFIVQAKKRIRTTSNVGKTSSLKRG